MPESSPLSPARMVPFVREVPLEPGPNAIVVTAIDTGGLSRSVPFRVERRLRFHETQYFVPSAVAGAFTLVGLGWGSQRLRRRRARRRRFNPYIAGAPVLDDGMFYGRAKLTARMLSTLHRNSLMITGERRIGKTTFLHHLKRVLEDDEGGEWTFFPVFVDLQGVPEQAFFHALMAETVDSLELPPATRAELRFTPDAAGYDARDFSHDLQRVIGELKKRTPRRVKLALLIDEVDVLNSYSESVNQRLRGIFMKSFSENLVAVMSGVGIRRRWKSEVQPLVQLLRRGGARRLLARGGRGAGARAGRRRLPLAAGGGRARARAVASCARTWCRSSASTRSTGCWSRAAARSGSRTSRRRATSSRTRTAAGAATDADALERPAMAD